MAPQIVVSPEEVLAKDSVWVFGYGSLIWRPNFEFTERKIGFVKGFVTRFWQGSIAHRGTPDKPGRVATMVEQKEGQAWGMVFKLEGPEQITKAFMHLNMRECLLGCYQVQQVPFTVVSDNQDHSYEVQALAFRATPDNDLFKGPETVEGVARVVASSRGGSGHNAEYLFRLVDFMHQMVPNAKDRYLFELEAQTRRLLECDCSRDTHHHHHQSRNSKKKQTSHIHKKAGETDKSQYYHKCYIHLHPTAIEQRAN